ncbi:TPA: amino acid ABC transporter ATP-binding protein [Aeromonas hydrophila]|uniref:amino acid ABC transporter ATP-binding protein n=1 Tax=Aeromonas hydrophila TaxID=644 RepID=UPI001302F9F8|nr:amino acid ABC transporter ATP-binding protein [Aeromonas hydrophila]MCR3903404.1 amino acid ABC transporter ATP-binding protein [Aeromonas hydrophila]QGZ72547.1 ATP-binding cassette domain-containing protein [Aeromonas hydrophila]HAU4908638.1 amino acid ABC transporter ATP-binding protein [Aeromonas hydrophila]
MIRLSGIEKQFAGQRVLKGVGLAMAAGSVTALIGPSGSGKSTLLRCVNLLERPDAGQLVLGGSELDFTRHLSRQSVLALRQQTGMVFQNFQLFPHMTVLENVMEGLVTVLKWPRERAAARALQLLDKVGLRHKAEVVPATLSGGQQQRVAIARALAPAPKVLLCDEPTSALDPELAQEVVAVLRQLASEGTTMLIATHDLRLAAQIAQQVIFLEAGEVVEAGSARQMFTTPKRARTFEYISTLTERLPESWSI